MILGMNPALLGTLLAIPRFWDGITDPIMGRILIGTKASTVVVSLSSCWVRS